MDLTQETSGTDILKGLRYKFPSHSLELHYTLKIRKISGLKPIYNVLENYSCFDLVLCTIKFEKF